jgi:hypothetical protein
MSGDVFLATDGVDGDDAAFQMQQPQQLCFLSP